METTFTGTEAAPDLTSFYRETGLAGRVGFGANPAVVLVDMQVAWNDPARRLGADMGPALDAIVDLVAAARARNVPIVYIWTAWQPDGSDIGRWEDKIPALPELKLGSDGVKIHPRLAPHVGDRMVLKKGPSGFFKTCLAEALYEIGIDTVILAGASTSGCVRATSIDSLSNGFRTILPAEAVGDRAQAPHEANLFDIDAKYGDVVSQAKVLDYLQGLPSDPQERRRSADPPRPTPVGGYALWGEDEGQDPAPTPTSSVTMAKQVIPVPEAPSPREGAPYSQLVRHGDLLFLSGQIPVDSRGSEVPGAGIAAQTEQVLDNVAQVLAAAGASLQNVLKATVYLADLDDWPEMNRVYARRLGADPPARCAVQVGLPADIKIEIDVIAHV